MLRLGAKAQHCIQVALRVNERRRPQLSRKIRIRKGQEKAVSSSPRIAQQAACRSSE
jgi:hypothetical protein